MLHFSVGGGNREEELLIDLLIAEGFRPSW